VKFFEQYSTKYFDEMESMMPAPSADRDSDATRDDVTVPRPTTDFAPREHVFTRHAAGRGATWARPRGC